MKTAVVFYSYDGNCALVANLLKSAAGADLYELRPLNEKKRAGFAKYFWGGAQVVFGKRPVLKPLDADLNAYDMLILGTPVWAGSPSPAMISFLAERKITGKKIAFYCSFNGNSGKTFEKLRTLLPGNSIVGEIGLKSPAGTESAALKAQIEEWAKNIGARS